MDELSQKRRQCDYITKTNMEAGFHLLCMSSGHQKFNAFKTKYGLYDSMAMPFDLTNAPATFQTDINRILLLGDLP
jgi:hypothetical protein